MSEVIVVTSGKGGVGKTTTSANVGTGLAAMGKRVVMIDTDIGLRNLDVVMGLENRIVYNLVDVVESKCRVKQALIKDKRYPSLYLMPSAQTKDKTAVNPEQMVKMINQLREQFDYIILDSPPSGFLGDAIEIGEIVDGFIYVISHNCISKSYILRSLSSFDEAKCEMVGFVINHK